MLDMFIMQTASAATDPVASRRPTSAPPPRRTAPHPPFRLRSFPTSRRRFLRRLSGAVAAASLPYWLPGLARGAESPNARINMGFIGLGGQGTGHLLGGAWTYIPGGYVARGDVQVRAVCDVRRERRLEVQARCNEMYARRFERPGYQDVRAYADFRELLARPDLDAVLLALPYHWAAPMAIRALRAGRDVYGEKPVAITVHEAQTLEETARRFGRVFQAGTQQRSEYGGKFRRACELVRAGRLGRLREVFAYRPPGAFVPRAWTSERAVPVPDGLDWDLWLGPLPWRPYGGELGHALPGLFVGDVNWSPHHYDIILWTVNPDPRVPVEIEFDGRQVHYHFAGGVVVHADPYPGEPVGGEGGACFVGTEGRLAVDRGAVVAHPAHLLTAPLRPEDPRVEFADSHSGNFLDCVRTRRDPICHAGEAARTMTTILAGGSALALRRSLRWDPFRQEFPGDAEANRLLSYAHRPPWRL